MATTVRLGVDADADTLAVSCEPDVKTQVIAAAEEAGAVVDDFHTTEASLEDLFLAYTEGEATPDEESAATADDPAEGSPARPEEVDG